MPNPVFNFKKIKTKEVMERMFRHNCRIASPPNVIKELTSTNVTLVALPTDANGVPLNYEAAVKKRIDELEYHKTHKIRKNQVLAYDVILSFSRGADIDVDEWEKRSIQWLKSIFDVAPDDKSNILHAVSHHDETGNVHIHALVIPVDENGHLNARRFTNGRAALSDLQTSYSNSVADLGLERGVKGSSARHKDIKKYYAELNKAIEDVPEVLDGETAEEYRIRTFETIQEQLAASYREKNEYDAKLRASRDKYFNEQKDKHAEELIAIQESINTQLMLLNSLNTRIKELEEDIAKKKAQNDDYDRLVEDSKEYEKIFFGSRLVSELHPEKSREIDDMKKLIIDTYEEWNNNLGNNNIYYDCDEEPDEEL